MTVLDGQKKRVGLLEKLNNTQETGLHKHESKTADSLRINRFLSRCGLGARRDMDELIRAGRVTLNDEIVTDFSTLVHPKNDSVKVDGKPVESIPVDLVIAFNKPPGYLCSHMDVFHDKTVFNLLPVAYKKMNMAGRLDLLSRGLMIFTSDGDLIQTLSHPSNHLKKKYLLQVENCPDESVLRDKFLRGVEEGGELLRAREVEVSDPENGFVFVVLEEGKKRQLHRMFATVGSKVIDLQRVQMGNLKLENLNLKEGEFKEISKEDIF
ncbi:MAG: rRNA pseudouridine synthase [Leptospira sp.]|nr:rRNA pseudouridine synthase [Leptospira sp.]